MAMPSAQALPPLDQHQRLDTLLAELKPHMPKGVSLTPEWLPDLAGWNLWLTDQGSADGADLLHFNHLALERAEKQGIDIDIIPTAVKQWGHLD